MTIYDLNNLKFIWRGITLSGFASDMYSAGQKTPSLITLFGIGPDMICTTGKKRLWEITASFLPNSASAEILEQDNLNNTVDTLIIRDLNTGIVNTYTNCYISSISYGVSERKVIWQAGLCNGR